MTAATAARTPLAVRCPFCHAAANDLCRVGKGTRHGFHHPARIEAARPAPTTGA